MFEWSPEPLLITNEFYWLPSIKTLLSLTNWRTQQSCWKLHYSKLHWVINQEQNNHGEFEGSFLSLLCVFFLIYDNASGPLLTGSHLLLCQIFIGEHLTMLWNHTTLSASHSGFSSQTAQLNTVQLGIFSQDLNFWASNWLVSTLLWVITLMNVKKKKKTKIKQNKKR